MGEAVPRRQQVRTITPIERVPPGWHRHELAIARRRQKALDRIEERKRLTGLDEQRGELTLCPPRGELTMITDDWYPDGPHGCCVPPDNL